MKSIAVIGNGDPSHASESTLRTAHAVGKEIARSGFAVICGGLGGVMEAACMGARSQGGLSIGVLPGLDASSANPFVDIRICTGMAIGMRDDVIIHSAEGVIVVGGGAGTLGEIALSYMYRKPVILVQGTGGWAERLSSQYLDEREKMKIAVAATAEEAVAWVVDCIRQPGSQAAAQATGASS